MILPNNYNLTCRTRQVYSKNQKVKRKSIAKKILNFKSWNSAFYAALNINDFQYCVQNESGSASKVSLADFQDEYFLKNRIIFS